MKRIGSRPFCIIMSAIITAAALIISIPIEPVEWKTIYSELGLKASAEDGNFVHYLDVGQSDCTVIASDSAACLIDCSDSAHGDVIVDKLDSLGFDSLSFIIITHAHDDHIGGLEVILKSIDVDSVIISDWTPADEDEALVFKNIRHICNQLGVTIIDVTKGSVFNLGDFKLEILDVNPDANDENDRSAIIRADCGDSSFLFTGDASSMIERQLCLSGADIDCDILKAGHHGSSYSTSTDFLRAVSPGLVIFSCSSDNAYGHPSSKTLARVNKECIDYYRTDVNGDICVNADRLSVAAQYDNPHSDAA